MSSPRKCLVYFGIGIHIVYTKYDDHMSGVRYDDSGAVMRLLQSRQRRASRERAPSIPGTEARVLLEEAETIVEMEDTDKEEEEEDTETELSRDVIYEHQDENTLI